MSSTLPNKACDKSSSVNVNMPGNQQEPGANRSESADHAWSLFQATLLKEMHESVIFLDANCQILFWNQSATDLTGLSSDMVLGQVLKPGKFSMTTLNGQAVEEVNCPFRHALGSGEKTEETFRLVGRNGRRLVVELRVIPVTTDVGQQTNIDGAVVTFHDVSELFQLREQQEHFASDFSLDPLIQVPDRVATSKPLPALPRGDSLDEFDPLKGVSFPGDGKRLLFAADFISINPMYMVGEKLVGFIRDSGSRLLECRHDFVSLMIATRDPNDPDRESTFQVDIELHDAGRNPSGNPYTRIRLLIHPPKRKILGQIHEDLYSWIVRDLRRYLMISDNDTSTKIFIGEKKTN